MTKLFFLPTLINKPISMQILLSSPRQKNQQNKSKQKQKKERKRGRRQKAKIIDAFKDNNRKSLCFLFVFLSL